MPVECERPSGVSFRAYCEVMNVMGLGKLCDEIYGGNEGEWQKAPVYEGFCRETVGDGRAMFPKYYESFGKRRIERWQEFEYWNATNDAAPKLMERAMLLGGAFEIFEIPSYPADYSSDYLGIFREDLPIELTEKMQNLYIKCLALGSEKCSSDETAQEVKNMWRSATEHLRDVPGQSAEEKKHREYDGRLKQLKENFALLEKRAPDRAKLKAAVQVYIDGIPAKMETLDKKRQAIESYRLMVKSAIWLVYGNRVPPEQIGKAGVPTVRDF